MAEAIKVNMKDYGKMNEKEKEEEAKKLWDLMKLTYGENPMMGFNMPQYGMAANPMTPFGMYGVMPQSVPFGGPMGMPAMGYNQSAFANLGQTRMPNIYGLPGSKGNEKGLGNLESYLNSMKSPSGDSAKAKDEIGIAMAKLALEGYSNQLNGKSANPDSYAQGQSVPGQPVVVINYNLGQGPAPYTLSTSVDYNGKSIPLGEGYKGAPKALSAYTGKSSKSSSKSYSNSSGKGK